LSENDTGPTALFSDSSSASTSASSSAGTEVKQAGGGPGSAPPDILDDSKVSGAGSASSSTSSEVVPFEVKLEQLQSLGFNRGEAETALMQADGEVNLAASILFSSK
jgi:hypothetical protein